MTEDDMRLVVSIKERVAERPELLSAIVIAATSGAESAALAARRAQADWEAVAAHAIAGRMLKKAKMGLAVRIEQLSKNAVLNWEILIKGMKE